MVDRVLFKRRQLDGIAAGTVTLAFRRWERPRVKAGTRLRTAVGVVAIDAVQEVDDVTTDEARRAGVTSRAEALGEGRSGRLYRIELRFEGADPRLALRAGEPTPEDFRRLERMGPWTYDVLRAIADKPGVRAADLAAGLGREKRPFKADVRKLKELGLTESLPTGYRLSPRGRAVLLSFDVGSSHDRVGPHPHERRARWGRGPPLEPQVIAPHKRETAELHMHTVGHGDVGTAHQREHADLRLRPFDDRIGEIEIRAAHQVDDRAARRDPPAPAVIAAAHDPHDPAACAGAPRRRRRRPG